MRFSNYFTAYTLVLHQEAEELPIPKPILKPKPGFWWGV